MKKTVLLAALLITSFSASAVVGGPNASEGEASITSGSSASATTAVGPNGTEYTSKVEMTGGQNNIVNETIQNISTQENSVNFNGLIRSPTPCHTLEQETNSQDENNYTLNIRTVKDTETNATQCVQQAVMMKYNASFEAQAPYQLELKHNNQTIETIENGEMTDPNSETNENNGFISKLAKWFGNLF